MRVYFLDVGQGTCNIIPVGTGRAIVIDTGREFSTLKRFLHKLKINTVTDLVISHCDEDHWGGAPALLSDTTITTQRICFHIDHKTKKTRFWDKLQEMIQANALDPEKQLIQLCCDEKPRRLWEADDKSAEIKILAPTFGQQVTSHLSSDANRASGVLLLRVGKRSIVFPGDAHFNQWEAIKVNRGKPLDCDVIAVPHHGGIIWDDTWNDDEVKRGLIVLYQRYVKPKYAVVSVGTSNPYSHPREDVIRALRMEGATILCTQLTGQCCSDLEKSRKNPVRALLVKVPGASLPTLDQTDSGVSRNVACAGTVVADVSAKRVTIRRRRQHKKGIDLLKSLPLCRR